MSGISNEDMKRVKRASDWITTVVLSYKGATSNSSSWQLRPVYLSSLKRDFASFPNFEIRKILKLILNLQIMGFACYFSARLYKDVTLSIVRGERGFLNLFIFRNMK